MHIFSPAESSSPPDVHVGNGPVSLLSIILRESFPSLWCSVALSSFLWHSTVVFGISYLAISQGPVARTKHGLHQKQKGGAGCSKCVREGRPRGIDQSWSLHWAHPPAAGCCSTSLRDNWESISEMPGRLYKKPTRKLRQFHFSWHFSASEETWGPSGHHPLCFILLPVSCLLSPQAFLLLAFLCTKSWKIYHSYLLLREIMRIRDSEMLKNPEEK